MRKTPKRLFAVQGCGHSARIAARLPGHAVALFLRQFRIGRCWQLRATRDGGWQGIHVGLVE